MNVVNRIIAIIVFIVLIVATAVSIYFALTRPEAAIAAITQSLNTLSANLTLVNRMIFSLVALLVLVLAAFLLWLDVRRPTVRAIHVQQITGGEARVTIDSIVQRLEYNVGRLQDVKNVKPFVSARGSGVEVMLSLQTSPEIDIPMKTEEVMQVAKDVVEKQMGLRLNKVSVEIKHAPYSEEHL